MPAVMEKPSFDTFSPKGKKVSKESSKEYGGGGGGSGGSDGEGKGSGRHPGKKGGKRSFLQKAKKFGKQGKLGKGTQVDSETYSYFVRILELLRKDEFDTDEERETFVENSLTLADGSEVQLAGNQLVSRVVENLLPLASEDRIDSFCQAFTPSLRVIVSDAFASHVLEKLLELTSSDKWRTSEKLTAWFEKTSMFILNNFEDFTFDTYGSFVTKKVLECLSGNLERPNEQDIAGMKGSKSSILRLELYGIRTRNPKWEKMLQDFARRFAAWPQFNDLGLKVETSRLLQNVIQTVHRTENSGAVAKELIVRVLGTLPENLEVDDSAHRILEVALPVADEKMYGIIFEKYYKGKLATYIHGPCFTLQKVISAAPEKHFKAIFDELAPEITSVLEDGRTVIIHNLASHCIKYNVRQEELWKLLKDAFKIIKKNNPSDGKANLLMTVITVKPTSDKAEQVSGKFSTTYHGSSIVQALLDFSSPVVTEVLKCFEELKAPEILKLALDPKASFIISKLFKSWNVPRENKEKLLGKLQNSLVELATTKFGSRLIDLIWIWADISQKTTVATVLSQRIPVLSSNKYGRFLVETMGLQALVRNKKEWTEHIAAQEKRKKETDKIAVDLGITSGNKPASPVSNEEPKSAKKAKKRKSEAIVAESEAVETPKSKKKNRKSEAIKLEIQSEEVHEPDTPKKSKKKQRKSHAEAEATLDAEVKMELDDTTEGQSETPKKKKKNKKSESNVHDQSAVDIPEVSSETPKKKKKNRKSEKNDDEANVTLASEVECNDTPKKKKKKDRASKQF